MICGSISLRIAMRFTSGNRSRSNLALEVKRWLNRKPSMPVDPKRPDDCLARSRAGRHAKRRTAQPGVLSNLPDQPDRGPHCGSQRPRPDLESLRTARPELKDMVTHPPLHHGVPDTRPVRPAV